MLRRSIGSAIKGWRPAGQPRHATRAALAVFACLGIASCGDGRGITPPPEPEPPGEQELRPVVGNNVPVTVTVDTSGGVIAATGLDGRRYELTIPRHALSGPVAISVTPLESFEGVPLSGSVAAASLEPDGLSFRRPVELQIVAPAAGARGAVGLSHSGDDLHLVPALVTGDTARLQLMHFSNGGVGSGTAQELAAIASGNLSSAGGEAEEQIAAELARASEGLDEPDATLLADAMRAWYEEGVAPALANAEAGAIETALGEWFHWLTLLQLLGVTTLDVEIVAAEAAAASLVLNEINRLNELCAANDDVSVLSEIGNHVGFAAAANLDRVAPDLTLEAVAARLCVQVVIIEAEMIETGDDTRTLNVQAGVSVGGRDPTFDAPLDLELTADQVVATPTTGTTDAEGRFRAEVRVNGSEEVGSVIVDATYPPLTLVSTSRSVPVQSRGVELLSASAFYDLNGIVWHGDSQDFGGVSGSAPHAELEGDTTLALAAGASTASGTIAHATHLDGPTPEYLLRLRAQGDATGSVTTSGPDLPQASLDANNSIIIAFEVRRPVYYQLEGVGLSFPVNESNTGETAPGVLFREGPMLPDAGPTVFYHAWTHEASELSTGGWLEPGRYFISIFSAFLAVTNDGTKAARAQHDVTFTLLAREPE